VSWIALSAEYLLWLPLCAVALRWPGVGLALALLVGRYPFPTRGQPLVLAALVLILFASLGMIRSTKKDSSSYAKILAASLSIAASFGLIGSARLSLEAADYGIEKGLSVLFIVIPLIVAVTRLHETQLSFFLGTLVVVPVAFVILGVTASTSGRMSVLGGGPIVLAQLCGIAIIVLTQGLNSAVNLVAFSGLYRVLRPALLLLLILGMWRSGSRGPFLALFPALILCALISSTQIEFSARERSRAKSALIAIGTIPLSIAAVAYLLSRTDSRFALLRDLATEVDRSRGVAFQEGIHLLQDASLAGHGFGAYLQINPELRYPHNFFLETVSEAGLAGLIVVVLVIWSLVRSARLRNSLAFGLTFYALTTAMFSGDIYNHRYLLVFAALASRLEPQIVRHPGLESSRRQVPLKTVAER
jgi:hypothetical protein